MLKLKKKTDRQTDRQVGRERQTETDRKIEVSVSDLVQYKIYCSRRRKKDWQSGREADRKKELNKE